MSSGSIEQLPYIDIIIRRKSVLAVTSGKYQTNVYKIESFEARDKSQLQVFTKSLPI